MAKKQTKSNTKSSAKANIKKKNAHKAQQQRIIAIAAVILVIAAVFMIARTGNSSASLEIDTATAYQKFQDGAFMLDVRTPEEWVKYHVDGATLIPLDELEARVNEVPRDREIIVICNSGNRSQVGRNTLLDAGFANVSSIAGGIQGWMSAGHDFVTGE